jgi:hypothetical protein
MDQSSGLEGVISPFTTRGHLDGSQMPELAIDERNQLIGSGPVPIGRFGQQTGCLI